ncbi:hypothetical protein, partial [Stenotrophomonas maltophilia]|uniref:hypothetical protein n=3 Tax=Stenotrophomonas maltophilia TaxID=40324 RepID=UPI001955367B
MAIQIPGRCGSTGDLFVSGVRSVFLPKTDLTPCAAVSTKVDIHQQQRGTVEGGVGPVAGVSAAWMPRP